MKKNCWRYHHFTHVYQKPQSYVVQFLRMEWDRIFLSICAIFCPYNPLLPPNYPENQNVEKIKKASGDVIILNLCNKNKIIWCMLTQIWSATYIIFCHFRPTFALLPHCWPQKLKLWKNVKKYLMILSFYTCIPLIQIIWCMVPEIWSATDRIFLPSCAIFCPFTLLTAQKMKIKKKKKGLEISSFNTSVPKIMIRCFIVPEIWHMTDVNVIFHFGLIFAFLSL